MAVKKYIIAIITIALLVSVSISVVSSAVGPPTKRGSVKVIFPTVTIHMLNGKIYSITGKLWAVEILPLFYGGKLTSYNWANSTKLNYMFFDKSLKALNPFGVEFVFALEKYHNVTLVTITDALLSIRPLPSVNPPYTNGAALDHGILPGIPSTVALSKHNTTTEYYQFAVVVALIAIVIVLHYVFKKF